MFYKRIILFLGILIWANGLHAQQFPNLFYDNHVYDDAVNGLKVELMNAPCAPPVLELNGTQRLYISFDDLNAELRDLKYTLIHCSYDWKQTSSLQKHEYLSGFGECNITQYEYSMNSLQHFINYSFYFPNEEMQPILSGNYLLCVYEDEEHLLFTYRLMVVEQKSIITPEFQASSNISERFTHQEIRFQVQPSGIHLQNPFRNVKAVVMQNMRSDNAMLFEQPYSQQGELLLYNKPGANTMEGGVEFHRFNMESLLRTLENIRDIRRTDDYYHVYLYPDLDRSYKPYFSEKDINGCYIPLRSSNAQSYEFDYAKVHFEFHYDKQLDGDIYLFGEMTNWRFTEEAKMSYDKERQAYTADLYLHTGYYNYTYLYVPKQGLPASYLVEGSHWETENNYIFLIYYHPDGTDYDQLIGYKQSYYTE